MGITKECFMHYETLINNKLTTFNKCKVIEIGSQTVHFDDKNFLRQWAQRINISDEFANHMYSDISGQDMHKLFGHSYECVDFDDFNGRITPIKLDLNTDHCPTDLVNSADITTNYGTTKHLLNQINAFQFIHDITMPWGAMIHVLPIARWNHGFINYNPVFFTSLAYANQYKIVTLSTSKDLYHNVLQDIIPYNGELISTHEYIHVILIKTNNDSFKIPTQIFSNGVPQ